MVGRAVKRITHRLLRGLMALPRVVLLVVALLAFGGVAVATTTALAGVSAPRLSLSLPTNRKAPEATDNYLTGQQTYNLDLMLTGLSDESAERMRSRSAVESLQRQMTASRDRGIKYEQIHYIGGQELPDGTSLQFYVVLVRGPTPRADLEPVTYIFTLDRGGKITRVQ